MNPEPHEQPLVRALVAVHRSERGALWVRVKGVTPTEDLGQVPLVELPVLLEALVAVADARPRT